VFVRRLGNQSAEESQETTQRLEDQSFLSAARDHVPLVQDFDFSVLLLLKPARTEFERHAAQTI
jgi:hypothetical protein